MNELVSVIAKEEIAVQISRVANEISSDYRGGNVVFIGILKGAFIFLSDLVRQVNISNIEVDFLQVSSYCSGSVSTGKVTLKKDIDVSVKDKNVIIVEDIVDTGLTLSFLVSHLSSYEPKTVKVCALIDRDERRQVDLNVDYVCSVVGSGFLVGYGLDYAEKYRNLPEVYNMDFS